MGFLTGQGFPSFRDTTNVYDDTVRSRRRTPTETIHSKLTGITGDFEVELQSPTQNHSRFGLSVTWELLENTGHLHTKISRQRSPPFFISTR